MPDPTMFPIPCAECGKTVGVTSHAAIADTSCTLCESCQLEYLEEVRANSPGLTLGPDGEVDYQASYNDLHFGGDE